MDTSKLKIVNMTMSSEKRQKDADDIAQKAFDEAPIKNPDFSAIHISEMAPFNWEITPIADSDNCEFRSGSTGRVIIGTMSQFNDLLRGR